MIGNSIIELGNFQFGRLLSGIFIAVVLIFARVVVIVVVIIIVVAVVVMLMICDRSFVLSHFDCGSIENGCCYET